MTFVEAKGTHDLHQNTAFRDPQVVSSHNCAEIGVNETVMARANAPRKKKT